MMATTATEAKTKAAIATDYRSAIDTLDAELQRVESVFRELSDHDWQRSTKLVPLDQTLKHWTVFELAGHFDISIGLARMLMADPKDGQPGRDRVSFFIFPRSEVAPVVYDFAYKMVEGKTPQQMPDVLHETFTKTIQGARTMAPDTVGPGYYALMRLDEFVASRVVEAVVHGFDPTRVINRESIATPEGVAVTAGVP